jgi:hypothetical protein
MHNLSQFLKGSVIVTNTNAAPTSEYFAVQVVAAAVISSVTFSPNTDVTGSWTSFTSIPAGTILYGRFKTLTLTSGQVVLYKL